MGREECQNRFLGFELPDGAVIEIKGKTETEHIMDLRKMYGKLIIRREGNCVAVFNDRLQPIYMRYL